MIDCSHYRGTPRQSHIFQIQLYVFLALWRAVPLSQAVLIQSFFDRNLIMQKASWNIRKSLQLQQAHMSLIRKRLFVTVCVIQRPSSSVTEVAPVVTSPIHRNKTWPQRLFSETKKNTLHKVWKSKCGAIISLRAFMRETNYSFCPTPAIDWLRMARQGTGSVQGQTCLATPHSRWLFLLFWFWL